MMLGKLWALVSGQSPLLFANAWSDKARQAAIEARRAHLHEGFNHWHESDHPTKPHHVEALATALMHDDELHKHFFAGEPGKEHGGPELSDDKAKAIHESAKDWAGDEAPSAKHIKAMHWAAHMDPDLHQEMKHHVSALSAEHSHQMNSANSKAAKADWTCWFANEAFETPAAEKKTRRVMLAPYGDWPNRLGLQRFTKDDAQAIANEFDSTIKRALNPGSWTGLPWYEGHPDHPDFRGKPGHTKTTSVGRIKALEVGNDGLYAVVKFNEDGERLIVNESYHGHSVNWFLLQDKADKRAYRPFRLKSVGFTNEPNIPVAPVTIANAVTDMKTRFEHMAKLRLVGGLFANSGSSEGAKKGWQHRSKMAGEATKLAQMAHTHAEESGSHEAHTFAETAFRHAAKAHMDASDAIDEYQNLHGYDKEAAAKGAEHRGRFHGHNDFANKLNSRAIQLRQDQSK